MNVTDPRETYDDLVEKEDREVLGPERFEEKANLHVATAGWVVLGLAFDSNQRVLLIDEPWADGWTLPGGTAERGETLAETVTRELREETGIRTTPVRPRAINEVTLVNRETGATDGWIAVVFEMTADTTEVRTDLREDDEVIEDTRWFETLPDRTFDREFTEEVYERCQPNQRPR